MQQTDTNGIQESVWNGWKTDQKCATFWSLFILKNGIWINMNLS